MSVMIPALNAASVIDRCLDAVLAQELDLAFDVVVSVGPSEDDTAARVDARAARDARVRRIDNPSGVTPSALNLAIQASEGDLVVRSTPMPNCRPGIWPASPTPQLRQAPPTSAVSNGPLARRRGLGRSLRRCVPGSAWARPTFVPVATRAQPTPCTSVVFVASPSTRWAGSMSPSSAIRTTN